MYEDCFEMILLIKIWIILLHSTPLDLIHTQRKRVRGHREWWIDADQKDGMEMDL